MTASEKVIVKQKGLQCMCVCVCSTVFKLSQPSLCLALVKVPQQRAECAHGGALSPSPPLPPRVDEIFVEVTFVSRHSSEPAERFWFLLRGDLLGDALSEGGEDVKKVNCNFFSENRAVMPHTCRFYVLRIRPNMRSEHA